MKDIKLDLDGDFVMDGQNLEPETVTEEDFLFQFMYILANTGISKWKGSPKTGSRIGTHYGEAITMTQATQIAKDFELTLNSHPLYLEYKFEIIPLRIYRTNVIMDVRVSFGSLYKSIEATIGPFSNILFKKGGSGENVDVLDEVAVKWGILNR